MKRLVFLLPIVFFLCACDYGMYKVLDHGDDVEEREGNIETISGPTGLGSSYSFVVISDVHFGKSSDRHDDVFLNDLPNLNPQPSFCICLGDIADHGWKGEFEEYNAFVAKVEAQLANNGRVYSITGNHDLYNDGWDYYKKLVYPARELSQSPSFYRFTVNGTVSYYFIDTGSGSMGTEQFKYFSKAIRADKTKAKVVCSHYPFYGSADFFVSYYSLQNTNEADRLVTVCEEENVKLVLTGHMHKDHRNKTEIGSFTQWILPSELTEGQYLFVTVNGTSLSAQAKHF